MPTSDCFVSVIAPLGNDADIIGAFIEETIAVLKKEYENYELVLVDDGSTDETVEKVSVLLPSVECIRLIRLSRSFGRDIAIGSGLDTVIGDFVVVMSLDSDPPDVIPQIVEQCRRGPGIVFGIRSNREGEPLYLRAGASLFYWFFNRVFKMVPHTNVCTVRGNGRSAMQ